MIALIDGDSIPFMLGWHHRDHQDIPTMYQAVDKFLEDLFILTGADMYYGALGTEEECFRYEVYKVKPYKGTRGEVQEHMKFWRPVITEYLKYHWKFDLAYHTGCHMEDSPIDTPEGKKWRRTAPSFVLEADDLINTAVQSLVKDAVFDWIICSPDKDMRQRAGMHYDYKTGETFTVDKYQANYNFFKLMLAGDEVDNIAGIPGFGPKKTQEKLKPLLEQKADRTTYEELVKSLYHRHFGSYYGDIIYSETEQTISLVWDQTRQIAIQAVPRKQELHPFDQMNRAEL